VAGHCADGGLCQKKKKTEKKRLKKRRFFVCAKKKEKKKREEVLIRFSYLWPLFFCNIASIFAVSIYYFFYHASFACHGFFSRKADNALADSLLTYWRIFLDLESQGSHSIE
jgi:hypothetical protein